MQIGAYRVVRRIGKGGMGSVWLAQHLELGRLAALKVLHAELSARQDIVARFFNEARAATAISDPGIVQIFEYGHHTDGSAYIVMELLEGEGLRQRLKRLRRLPMKDALRILRQTASSLGVAHAAGVVHRDLKPDNLFLVRDPEVPGGERVKILDFGIAKLASDTAGIRTKTSAVIGTPAYMSPEQCRGAGQVDQRTDVYSLGCVLFALIAGAPPFTAAGAGDLIAMHLREPAPLLSSRIAGVPPAIDALVASCLEKDPAQRPASGTELANALAALPVEPTGANAEYVPGSGSTGPSMAQSLVTTLSGSATSLANAPRGRRLTVAVAGVAMGIAGVVVWTAIRAPAQGSTPVASPPSAEAPRPDAAPRPDKAELAKIEIKRVLDAFRGWAARHPDQLCPSIEDMRRAMDDPPAAEDPWGQRLSITCTGQPADQMIGVISAGPDGVFDNQDDIKSWTLDGKITRVVAGPRWQPSRPSATEPSAPTPGKASRQPSPTRKSTQANHVGKIYEK